MRTTVSPKSDVCPDSRSRRIALARSIARSSTASIAPRSPSESHAPLRISASTTRRFRSRLATRRQRSKSDANGTRGLALGNDLGGHPLADVLDVTQPVEDLALLLRAEAER